MEDIRQAIADEVNASQDAVNFTTAPDHLFMQFADAGFGNSALKIRKWDSSHNFDGAMKYLASTPAREYAPELLVALEGCLAQMEMMRAELELHDREVANGEFNRGYYAIAKATGAA